MILVLILALILPSNKGSTNEMLELKGRVVDVESTVPISGASVYLSHTMLGAATDGSGGFTISGIPEGTYQLVISRVGYVSEIMPVELTEGVVPDSIQVYLARALYDLGTIEVNAEQPNQWAERFDVFRKLFLGTMAFEEQAEILNPEHLEFEEEDRLLTAISTEPLLIQNDGLGYRILFQLMGFQWSDRDEMLEFTGAGYFEPMESDNDEDHTVWLANRKRAYSWLLIHNPPEGEKWETRVMKGTCKCRLVYFGYEEESTCRCYYN